MEIIKKQISIEPFKSRLFAGFPFVGMEDCPPSGKTSDWGEIAMDIDFSKFSAETLAKCGEHLRNWGRMSYRQLVSEYNRIKNITIQERLLLPDTPETKLRVAMEDELVFFVDTYVNRGKVAYDYDACTCKVIDYGDDDVEWFDDCDACVEPTINLLVHIVQKPNLVGAYTFASKDWQPGKKYYIGDVVIYNGQAYELDAEALSVGCVDILEYVSDEKLKDYYSKPFYYKTGTTIDDVEQGATEDLFYEIDSVDALVQFGYTYAKIDGVYYARPFFAGYTKNYEIYFDDVDDEGYFQNIGDDGSTTHWKLHNDICLKLNASAIEQEDGVEISGTDIDIVYESVDVEGVVLESRLNEFYRKKKSIDDDGGELPGVISGTCLDSEYFIGTVRNPELQGDGYLGNLLYNIVLKNADGEAISGDIHSNEDYVSALEGLSEGVSGKIELTYYIGCEVVPKESGNGFEVWSGFTGSDPFDGIKYTDTYDFEVKAITATINETEKTFTYIDIDYDSGSEIVVLENLDNLNYLTKLSSVKYNTLSCDRTIPNMSPDFVNVPYFMEDYKIGTTYVNNELDDIIVDRGNAAAFEKHLRLTEVKTMQDLENYGNNYFKIR